MKPLSRSLLAVGAVVAFASAAGCDLFVSTDERLAHLYGELQEAVGEAHAGGIDRCRAVPVGRKACGGPSFYVVYSLDDGDPDRVVALARRFTEIQAANPGSSDCEVIEPPPILLVGGRCVAGP